MKTLPENYWSSSINSVKQLDTKLTYRHPLNVITQTTKYQEDKLMKQSHLLSHENNKIPRNEPAIAITQKQ